MADPRSLPPVESPASERDYNPVSGVAVAAIVVAGVYGLILFYFALAAVYFKRPALDDWLKYLAVPGLVLSIAARLHIRRSQGTRIGLQLAATAWWLSVIGGVGYGAYYFATIVALRQQSELAAKGWFDKLKKQEIDQAFLLTRPPLERQTINPNDTGRIERQYGTGLLPGFRNSELVRFFRRNGADVDVQSIGVNNLYQFENGYRIDVTFHLTSPEGRFEISVALIGTEGPNIVGREWQIALLQQQVNSGEPVGKLVSKGVTEYGWLVQILHGEADGQARKWLAEIRAGFAGEAVLATLPAAERPAFVAYFLNKSLSAWLPIYLAPPMPPAEYDSFASGSSFDFLWQRGFFKIEGPDGATQEKKNRLRDVWNMAQFVQAGESRLMNPETAPRLALAADMIEYAMPLDVRMPGSPPTYANARIILGCDAPDLLPKVRDIKARSKTNPNSVDVPPRELFSDLPARNWRVLRLETNLEPLEAPPRPQGQ